MATDFEVQNFILDIKKLNIYILDGDKPFIESFILKNFKHKKAIMPILIKARYIFGSRELILNLTLILRMH